MNVIALELSAVDAMRSVCPYEPTPELVVACSKIPGR
jgi:hypothetical protein